MRVKLLGEDLIGFRATTGAVGLMQNACPHRGASLFFGRNEEEGLRCVYHGWKFDVAGACVDMPSEPAESNFKTKVRAIAYPTHERNGIIWAYMGPRRRRRRCPIWKRTCSAEERRHLDPPSRAATGCRAGKARWTPCTRRSCTPAPTQVEEPQRGALRLLHGPNRAPSSSSSTRPTAPRTARGVRRRGRVLLAHRAHAVPVLRHDAGRRDGPADALRARTCRWTTSTRCTGSLLDGADAPGSRRAEQAHLRAARDSGATATSCRTAPAGTTASRWTQNMDNDYLIDREAQTNWQSYSGIPGMRQQDMAVTESMGPIYDRIARAPGLQRLDDHPHAAALACSRARLCGAGRPPPNVDNPAAYRLRSGEVSPSPQPGLVGRQRQPAREVAGQPSRSCSSRLKCRRPAANRPQYKQRGPVSNRRVCSFSLRGVIWRPSPRHPQTPLPSAACVGAAGAGAAAFESISLSTGSFVK